MTRESFLVNKLQHLVDWLVQPASRSSPSHTYRSQSLIAGAQDQGPAVSYTPWKTQTSQLRSSFIWYLFILHIDCTALLVMTPSKVRRSLFILIAASCVAFLASVLSYVGNEFQKTHVLVPGPAECRLRTLGSHIVFRAFSFI